MSTSDDTQEPTTFGGRVKRARLRTGMSRPVVGGLVARSGEWVKSIETGRMGMPALPLLLRLADVLGVDDLAELTGEERLSPARFTRAAHDALGAVREALTTYDLSGDDAPEPAEELQRRVAEAWRMWHADGAHRTRVAEVLPDLLADSRHASRALEGTARRRALVALAETYHLAQLFLSFQPVPELVMLTGDRAMAAAQDADSPKAMACAAWYMNHVFRDSGERHEARVDLAMRAADLLRREDSSDDRARWGLLHLAAALSYAKVGRKGDAERYWDAADRAARDLGETYTHPYLIFGRGMVDAYAITMKIDLQRSGEATDAAASVDLDAMPSATRRSFHLIETARAHRLDQENVAVVALLKKAHETSPETIRYNLFARSVVSDLELNGPRMIRTDARYLRHAIGAPALSAA